jgi:hypothetical protein
MAVLIASSKRPQIGLIDPQQLAARSRSLTLHGLDKRAKSNAPHARF